jgi:hypothetical protein
MKVQVELPKVRVETTGPPRDVIKVVALVLGTFLITVLAAIAFLR